MFRRALGWVFLFLLIPSLVLAAEVPILEGPVLISQLPRDAILIENTDIEGGYTQRLATSDGMANIILLRRAGSVSADALLKEFYLGAADVVEVPQADVASYPANRYCFTLGRGKDTRFGTLVVFQTDAYTFAFAVDVREEAAGDYADLIEWWIEALDLFDSAASAFAPAGLVLTVDIPEGMEQVACAADGDDYAVSYAVNGAALVTLLRRTQKIGKNELVFELYPDAEIVHAADLSPIDSYPAARVNFSYGIGENARFCSLVLVETSDASFAFIADAPYDEWNGDYSETVQIWIDSLNFVEQ